MSEQEIRNLQKEMSALTEAVTKTMSDSRKIGETAYRALQNSEDTKKKLDEIKVILLPISETYSTGNNILKFLKWIAFFIIGLLSTLLTLKELRK